MMAKGDHAWILRPATMLPMSSPVLDQRRARRIAEAGPAYRSTLMVTVQATQLESDCVWVSPTGSVLRGQAGDWLLRDEDSEWTVGASVFLSTYEEVSPGRWQ